MLKKLFVVLLLSTSIMIYAQEEVDHAGDVIYISGQIMDIDDNFIEGAVIEIWQADVNGKYDHPQDAEEDELLDNFQYFGMDTTDEDGYFEFITIKPPMYESFRPPHIHYIVKIDDEIVLPSQWYFEEDSELEVFNQSAPDLILVSEEPEDEDSFYDWVITKDIIIGETTRQQIGPYYPVVDVADYDNNLIVIAIDINESDTDELMQLPYVDESIAEALIDARPYDDMEAFIDILSEHFGEDEVTYLVSYLE